MISALLFSFEKEFSQMLHFYTNIQIYNNIVNRLLQAQVLITTRCFRPLLLTCVPCLYQQMNHSNNNFRDIITTL